MTTAARRVGLFALLTILVGCDHVTKLAAKSGLEGSPPRDLIRGVLDLHYTENRDVAFNLLRWVPEGIRAPLLVAAGAVALLALVLVLLRRPLDRPLVRGAVLLVTAGALGNYLDRLVRGYVVDFVHLAHWPVFNVADVYVTVGAAALAWSLARTQRSHDGSVRG
jgi:signal peptidase II